MPFQITILEADLEAKSDLKFCACYDPFWAVQHYRKERHYVLKDFGGTPEEAIEKLKVQIKGLLKSQRLLQINELTLQDAELV
jgi:hypothetical protein